MNAPDRIAAPALDWSSANQQLLAAEFARLRQRLGAPPGDGPPADARCALARAALPAPAAIDTLAALFQLSAFERELVLLAAGVEMDAQLAALCAQAGAAQRPWASFGLALAALDQPHWSALSPDAPLRRWRLLDLDEGAGLATARLRLDERVLHYLAGLNRLDPRLQPLLQPLPDTAAPLAAAHAAALDRLFAQPLLPGPALLLEGDDTGAQRDLAAALAARLGAGLYLLRAAEVPPAAAEQAAFAALWGREAALLGAGLLLEGDDATGPEAQAAALRLAGRLPGLVLLAARQWPATEWRGRRLRLDLPAAPERRRLWQQALGEAAAALPSTALDALASQYRLGARRIAEIAQAARAPDGGGADAAALHRAARDEAGREARAAALPGLAQRVPVRAGRDALVLPPAQQALLRQLVAHARHRLTVHHGWGFAGQGARGLGLATLFWGDSGTGKTLAAEVVAHELELALLRVDLSAVVSKYIGETEKNLRRVFDAAETAGAVLLFDEADALFGKRSEVKDSHDRYANIEVSYLLQRMEAYEGLAILTSNHKAALDPAFQRRLRFVVHFPFPDAAQREGIWRAVFPPAAPLHAGVDFARLARLDATGGAIRNIALSAAFLAAEAGTPIGMAQLQQAVRMEGAKRERPFPEAELRSWT
ncbi:ATP-binding protein [Pseudorhodoferax sp.]|uniref:ATP-binding protein n=1 Tax=Pseudorhodoferax sp. TaxID=1993553 RepID=UPI0039E2AFE9